MQLILMSVLLVGCGQQMIESSAPAPEAQVGTRAALDVVGDARMQQLARMAHSKAIASQAVARATRNPAESIYAIRDLVKELSAASIAGMARGERVSFWERFERPRSPVLRSSAPSQDGWRTWAEQVVDRYN